MRFKILTLLLLIVGQYALARPLDWYGPIKPCKSIEPGLSYYTIDLVTTKKVAGARQATGKAIVTFSYSPFGISIAKDGSYIHNLHIKLNRIRAHVNGVYVAWITTPNLEKINLLGVLNKNFQTRGTVEWNKYLVVITLEPSTNIHRSKWKGPIVLRGLSRSGNMHTMAGHGPFKQDPCAKFGY